MAAYDIAIVGAGIVGAACALEAARAGLRVCIVDATNVAAGATGAAMGHVVVMDDSPAQFALTRYSQQLWQELADDLPADVEYKPYGTIWIAADDGEFLELERKRASFAAHNVAADLLDANELAGAEPNLRTGLAGGMYVKADSVVSPGCAARCFVAWAVAAGAEFVTGVRVIALDEAGLYCAHRATVAAGIVVNAAGCWAPELTRGLVLRPRKGHLVLTEPYAAFVHHQLIELGYLASAGELDQDSVAFNVQPRRSGQLLIGSSRQFDRPDDAVEPEIMTRMLNRAAAYIPGIDRLVQTRSWTGFRAATADKLPLIGPHPVFPYLYLAAGHEGLGITTALGTARLLMDQVLGRASAIPVAPYLPARPGALVGL